MDFQSLNEEQKAAILTAMPKFFGSPGACERGACAFNNMLTQIEAAGRRPRLSADDFARALFSLPIFDVAGPFDAPAAGAIASRPPLAMVQPAPKPPEEAAAEAEAATYAREAVARRESDRAAEELRRATEGEAQMPAALPVVAEIGEKRERPRLGVR